MLQLNQDNQSVLAAFQARYLTGESNTQSETRKHSVGIIFKKLKEKISIRENLGLRNDFDHHWNYWIVLRACRIGLRLALAGGPDALKVSTYNSLMVVKKRKRRHIIENIMRTEGVGNDRKIGLFHNSDKFIRL